MTDSSRAVRFRADVTTADVDRVRAALAGVAGVEAVEGMPPGDGEGRGFVVLVDDALGPEGEATVRGAAMSAAMDDTPADLAGRVARLEAEVARLAQLIGGPSS